jgi:hypothetical protein
MYISINEFSLVTWLLEWGWLEATGRLPDSGIAKPPDASANPPERAQPAGRPVVCVLIYWFKDYSVKSTNSMELACSSKISFTLLQYRKSASEDHLLHNV